MSEPTLASLNLRVNSDGVADATAKMKAMEQGAGALEVAEEKLGNTTIIVSQRVRDALAKEAAERQTQHQHTLAIIAKETAAFEQAQATRSAIMKQAQLGLSSVSVVNEPSSASTARQAALTAERVAREQKASDHIFAIRENEFRKIQALQTAYENRYTDFAKKMASGSTIPTQNSFISSEMINGMTQASSSLDTLNQKNQHATAIYDALITKLSMTKEAYRALELSQQGMNKAQIAHIQSLEKTTDKASHLNIMFERTISIMTAMAAYRGLSFLLQVPQQILETNMNFEKLRVQLEGITGSAAGARMEFERMLALDVKTPFDIEGLTKTMILLKDYGLEPTDHVMKSLTDSVSKLGGGTETLIGIGRQLGQAWAKDKLQLIDMRPMIENGLPVIGLLQKALHTTAAGVLAMSAAGTIGRKEMLLLFDAMESWAPDASVRAMDTMYGALSNVHTAWQQLQDAFLQDKSEGFIKSAFESMSEIMNNFTADIKEANTQTAQLIKLRRELAEDQAFLNLKEQSPVVAAITNPIQNLPIAGLGGFSAIDHEHKLNQEFNLVMMQKIALRQKEEYAIMSAKAELEQLNQFEEKNLALTENQIKAEAAFVDKANKLTEMYNMQKLSLEEYVSLLEKYASIKDVVFAKENKKGQSEAQKEIARLTDEIDKLTKTTTEYNKIHSSKLEGDSRDIAQVEELKNKVDALNLSKKEANKAQQEADAAAKKAQQDKENFAKESDSVIIALMNEAEIRKVATKDQARETELRKAESVVMESQRGLYEELVNAKYDEIEARKEEDAAREASVAAMDREVAKYQELTLNAHDLYIEKLKLQKVPEADIPKLVAKHDTNTGLEKTKKQLDANRAAVDQYNKSVNSTIEKYSDLSAVTSAVFDGALGGVNILAGAFDNLVKSIAATTDEQIKLGETKKQIDAINPVKGTDTFEADIKRKTEGEKKYAHDVLELDKKVTLNKLAATRQIAGAVSSMLKEGSTEKRAAHAIEMALAGVELAMQVMKVLGIGAVTTAQQESVIPYITATMTKGQADAQAGVAAQAKAGPYIGFALMAAMAIAMAALGFSTSGAASTPPPSTLPISKDKGTILGDSELSSDSVNKTYELLKDIHAEEYKELRGINSGISELSKGITNVVTKMFQAGGLPGINVPGNTINYGAGMAGMIASSTMAALKVANFGIGVDPLGKWLGNFLFGGKQTSTMTAQGIATGPSSIGNILNGDKFYASFFADIQTKTKGGLFTKDKYSDARFYQSMDKDTNDAMTKVFMSMGKTMFGLAEQLGAGLGDRVKKYIIPAMMIDLKGLNGEDAAKKMNGVISTMLDTMAGNVFGDIIGQYQQLGEGMLETAVRIVAEVAVVKDALGMSGIVLKDNAIAISDALVQAAGGLKEFQAQFETYYEKFYTETEKHDRLQKRLTETLEEVNVILPTTREGYRKLIEGLDLANAADQRRYSTLLQLSESADQLYARQEETLQQRRSMEIELMQALGNASGALAAARYDELQAMDKSLRFIQKMIWALSAAKNAVDDAMSVLTDAVNTKKARLQKELNEALKANQDQLNAFISSEKARVDANIERKKAKLDIILKANEIEKKSAEDLLKSVTDISAQIKSALKSTEVVSASTDAAKRAYAQDIINKSLASAQATGKVPNNKKFRYALEEIAKPSTQLFTTFQDYIRDQSKTANALNSLDKLADAQISDAQRTIDAIDASSKAAKDASDAMIEAVKTNSDARIKAAQATADAVAKALQANFDRRTKKLDKILADAQAQVDAANGTTKAVLTVADAINALAKALKAQAKLKEDVTEAEKATTAEKEAKAKYDAAVRRREDGFNAKDDAVEQSQAKQAKAAALKAAAAAPIAPTPTTFKVGQTGNTAWETVLARFQNAHKKQFGVEFDRGWNADADAQAQYQRLVKEYMDLSKRIKADQMTEADRLLKEVEAGAASRKALRANNAANLEAEAAAKAEYERAKAYAEEARKKARQGFAVGINEVPYDMTANVHAGERIMPAADNRELMLRLSEPSKSNDELIAELRAVKEELVMLRAETRAIVTNTSKAAKILTRVTPDGDSIATKAV